MSRILVTGGFGFVGGHLVELLLRQDPAATVHVVDNLSTSPLPHERLLAELHASLGHIDRLSYDICSIEEWSRRSSVGQRWDEIYHLASVVGPAGVLLHAGRIVRSVVDDVYTLIEVAKRHSARLLFVSTSEVYGGGQEGYCSEDFPKIIQAEPTVRLEYAVAKLAAEVAVQNSCRVGELNAVIVRPFNISGPRQSGAGGFVLPRFVGYAMSGRALTVFGDGTQTRAFTHVRDVCSGILAAMQRGANGEAYNIGNPANRLTINELADIVIDVTGSTAGVVHVNPTKIYGPLYADANDKFPDARRASQDLGWVPVSSARDVVTNTYEYMREIPAELRSTLLGD